MRLVLPLVVFLCFTVTCFCTDDGNSTDFSESRVLSRKKRFLVFPEGSSFQLVFCVTYPALIEIGDIFLWGNTAALAFELPQDPYSPFDHRAEPIHRRVDTKVIYYTDEAGKIIHKQPYKRKPLVNPAFAKRSVDVNRKQMHASRSRLGFSDMDSNIVEFHRDSRTALYEKIETMLQGWKAPLHRMLSRWVPPRRLFLPPSSIVLGGNGRQCLLKTLCIIGQTNHYPQGVFLQEILRALFTLPKSNVEDPYYQEYDAAHTASGSCDELYPDCDSVSTDNTRTMTY